MTPHAQHHPSWLRQRCLSFLGKCLWKNSYFFRHARHVTRCPRPPIHAGTHDTPIGTRTHRHAQNRLAASFQTHRRRPRRAHHSAHNARQQPQSPLWPLHGNTGPHARRTAPTRHGTSTTRKGFRARAARYHAHRARAQATTTHGLAGWPRTAHRGNLTPYAAAQHDANPTSAHTHIPATLTNKSDGSIERSKQWGRAL